VVGSVVVVGSTRGLSGQNDGVDAVPAEDLLRLPVRLRGIDLGHAVDVILDPEGRRVLGLDVLCKDDSHRFLPLTAAEVGLDEIAVPSALMLLASDELAFYRKSASTLRLLRGAAVQRNGEIVGRLEDVTVSPNGTIATLIVDNGDGLRSYALDDTVRIAADPRRASAA
jgi:sporulation protein YlmC with PRC-barrel domain